ncbi:phospholipase A2 inhibitor and Ly6/PLAUR domain-containing protein-like isoform X3 [Ctenopharyngodon idella]|uniref:phospholipase A2 inhibitor and Ly6/PLAUR domain-containing protein-like isoform X2 n=1 Tax=Ctenopharyngodon idella TaxID=7959 RepID=UPI00222F809D|nr:phospholipase A2 inhibitor and Ly6/PLAUR domain-containing protein-like isoform X2 [Ctenopharyngodon idella]XP_051733850.1 phospholipase A2 inhibitor and Ly6/PLAUR domain-containing protein-like isoform X3 [Ctenopharyngodon idella]
MDLQISVFLLFVLFTAGQSRNCYQCTSLASSCDQVTCPNGFSNCLGATLDIVNYTKLTVKTCGPLVCPSGSINLGIGKISSYCCNTDLCNSQNAPDPSNTANGKSCYYCDGKNCLNTVSCTGSEDRCIKATGNFGSQSLVVKGCVSKFICDATSFIPNVNGISCCEGNLCNGAQSVTQSFLFLCCSLLSYFLLH